MSDTLSRYRDGVRVSATLLALIACCAFALAFLTPTQGWAAETISTTTSVKVNASYTGGNVASDVYDPVNGKYLGGAFTGMGGSGSKGYVVEASNAALSTNGKKGKLFVDGTQRATLGANVAYVTANFEFYQVGNMGVQMRQYVRTWDKNWGNQQTVYLSNWQKIWNGKNQIFSCRLAFEPEVELEAQLQAPLLEMTFQDGSAYTSGTWTNQDVLVRARGNQRLTYSYDVALIEMVGSKSQTLHEVSAHGWDYADIWTSWYTVGETPASGRQFTARAEAQSAQHGFQSTVSFPFGTVLVDKTGPVAKVSLGAGGSLVDASSDALSGLRSTEVAVVVDGAAGTGSYVPVGSASALDPSKSYTVRVRATDNAGNVSESVQHFGPGGSGGGTDPAPSPGTDPDGGGTDPDPGSGDGFSARRYAS